MLTDIKHVFAQNPLRPAYQQQEPSHSRAVPALKWLSFAEGIHHIGHDGHGFAFDNEGPRHRELVPAFQLASRLVTNGEYLAFMEDGGYERPEFWLSLGWTTVQENNWQAPFYWEKRDGNWWMMTLGGMREVDENEPVCHVSYFEADAYAHWAGARLPTEAEWEVASADVPLNGNFADNGHYHPLPPEPDLPLAQMFGDVWEWTRSPYSPYPGYAPLAGALGEYNGKFMCNQYVLRGGSCATSRSHIRRTYRNFFPPDARWQFTGIRLAKDV
jgi:ergothioneine biosynthesis protein EgtB